MIDEHLTLNAENTDKEYSGNLFEELSAADHQESHLEQNSDPLNIDLVMDVPVTVSIEMGRAQVNIRQLLNLKQGSVVELDRYAGEPVDVLVNGTLVAHGEVVVVNEKFGIRLTDVVSPVERISKLG